MSEESIKLIVGLGNPGFRYRNTRHNAGFMVLDRVADLLGTKIAQRAYNGVVGRGTAGDARVVLLKPHTMMNLSGRSVALAVADLGIATEDLLVVVDEVQLDPGRMRIRPKGSAGGHNGTASIIQAIGTDQFPRIRIGVGGSEVRGRADYVLSDFSRGEWTRVEPVLADAAEACLVFAREGIEAAMNRYNAG